MAGVLMAARQRMAHLAQTAGVQINGEPEAADFHRCVGENGEQAPDDRFTLLYAVHGDVPGARHNEVVRRARDVLMKEGLAITVFQEATEAKPYATLSARHPESRYVAAVDSTSGSRMALSVTTPCLVPPSGGGGVRWWSSR
ncbi:hypothetical protein ABT263_31495 [Kitasatospora sp. NPDC001603]|uniref:hypothetical protein n=1 Tax=Kitasatospora sp. NPDC001603 TaxID=3154388 RepID=UPI0033214974